MDPKDIYVGETSIKGNPVVSEIIDAMGDEPFHPISAEFLARCRAMLGERAGQLKIEEALAGWREVFARQIRNEGPLLAKKVLTASVMLIAAHDAIVAEIPAEHLGQILSLVAMDPRTVAHALDLAVDVEDLIPEEDRSLRP